MKRIDELGVSPMPWSVWHTSKARIKSVDECSVGESDVGNNTDRDKANARLIAAAPEMYQLIVEAIPWLADISAEVVGNKCAREIDDLVKRMIAALAKAAGEEVAK